MEAKWHKHPLVSHQPFRLGFRLIYSVSIILRLPYYATLAIIPAFRPDSRWTAWQTFMTRLAYPLLDLTSRIGITETLTLEKGKQGERFQALNPSPLDIYRGPLASKTVRPERIGGTWFPCPPTKDITSKTVILYFHGGAFIEGDGRDGQCGPIAKLLLDQEVADTVFSLQYRLSGYGGMNPYPAALQDALSSYVFLLNELHIPASQIIIGGDSAGGNLTTALLRYLHEFGNTISVPTPKCAFLISSWVEPFYLDVKSNPHVHTDFIPISYPSWGVSTYANWPNAAANPYITPLGNPFPTPVPIFASAGDAEMFFERIARWVHEMGSIDGNVVELYAEETAPHDSFLSGKLLGFEDSAQGVAAKVREFVRKI